MRNNRVTAYRVFARWPKDVNAKHPKWESWTPDLISTDDAVRAHKRLISKGAGKYCEFGLFYLETGKPKRLRRILSKPTKDRRV